MKHICIVVGARPNFVKVAPLIRSVQREQNATFQLVYTGRDDDPSIEPTLFDDLQMPRPNEFLGVDSLNQNEITAMVMARFDSYLNNNHTDVVIVVDDLASTLAAAITTKKRAIKLAHLVAGTRSFDITMPKEINRLVIDALSDYLFTAGIKSNSVASREQQSDSPHTFLVGNILMDTLRFNHSRLLCPPVVDGDEIRDGQYLVLTLNRHALLSDRDKLFPLLAVIAGVGMPVVAPLRHDARRVVEDFLSSTAVCNQAPAFRLVNPMSYLEFGWLTAHAKGIVTDSGNIAEEATFNHVPCMTLNSYTEHQETITIGSNVLVDGNPELLSDALQNLKRGEWKKCALPDRWDGRTADRIVQILLQ